MQAWLKANSEGTTIADGQKQVFGVGNANLNAKYIEYRISN